jgi:uncharacterized membrane protein
LGLHIPGLGIIFTVLLIFITGLITKSYLGRVVVRTGEGRFGRISIVRSIYPAIKQIFNSLFVGKGRSFRKEAFTLIISAGIVPPRTRSAGIERSVEGNIK